MKDALSGKFVAEPLRRGGNHCLFHFVLFCTQASKVEDAVIAFLDFESTGLSVYTDNIVEIGVFVESGEVFSTVVKPPGSPPSMEAVHGICDAELQEGPQFAQSFSRLVEFLDNVAENAVSEDESSDDDSTLRFKAVTPDVLIVAHNGIRFDFAMLISECYRSKVSIKALTRWRFVDTIDIVRALDSKTYGGCMKLQCLLHMTGRGEGLRAHRALDDAVALRDVINHIANRLGVSMLQFLSLFAFELDYETTMAQLQAIL